MATYARKMQEIVLAYVGAGQPWPATAHQMAAWAIREKLWQPQPSAVVNQCAEHLARAMREEYIHDPQGRTVRAKHVARTERNGEKLALWDDIRSADRTHMQIAFAQRRQAIVGDCRQLKTDVGSFNENRNPGPPIQVSLDFSRDVEELDEAA